MSLTARVARQLVAHVKQDPSYQHAIVRIATNYTRHFGRSAGWRPPKGGRAEITAAVAKDLGVEFECSTDPTKVEAFLRVKQRFDRKKPPLLLHPSGVSDEKALAVLEQIVERARRRRPFLVLGEDVVKAREDSPFVFFELQE